MYKHAEGNNSVILHVAEVRGRQVLCDPTHDLCSDEPGRIRGGDHML